jgi:hypothetical protein
LCLKHVIIGNDVWTEKIVPTIKVKIAKIFS